MSNKENRLTERLSESNAPISEAMATAIHEAGHATAAWVLGIRIHSMSIVPSPEADGFVKWDNILQDIPVDLDHIDIADARERGERLCISLLAGVRAQYMFDPYSWRSSDGAFDDQTVTELALRLFSDDDGEAWLASLSPEVEALLRRHWPLVVGLGQALAEAHTLTGAEVYRLLEQLNANREDQFS